jgi:glycerate kinase
MRIVIAPDSLKESLSAFEAAQAIAVGVHRACPDAIVDLVPMADGGEGTAEALCAAASGKFVPLQVTGPLGEPMDSGYVLLDEGRTAVVEVAAAAGLAMIPRDRRDPRITTTRGVGELIRHAAGNGARKVLVALGGSGTNDGGAGMAQALGYRLLDAEGLELPAGGAALAQVDRIDATGVMPELALCECVAACDVTNPLCGPEGASRMYGPQKGASPENALELDGALSRLGEVVARDLGIEVRDVPGAGAAGGMGAGVLAFLGGSLEPGAEMVARACGLESRIRGADLVITAEGRTDAQTVKGKTPLGVAQVALRCGVPTVVLAGGLAPGFEVLYEKGVAAVFPIMPGPGGLDEALRDAGSNLARTAESVVRLWKEGQSCRRS